MDHLRTDEERKSRWYAAHLRPIYIKVRESEVVSSTDLAARCVAGIPSSLFCSTDTATDEQATERGSQLLHAHLEEYGFAVVTNVLSHAECGVAIDLAWDYLEAASAVERHIQTASSSTVDDATTNSGSISSEPPSVRRDDPSTLSSPHGSISSELPPVRRDDPSTLSSPHYPVHVEGGILPFYGSGHTTLAWYLRDNSTLQAVFASLHNTTPDELITSLDGLVIWRSGDEHKTDAGWFHLDQNPQTKPGFESVQGLLNLLPVSASTGGNAVVAKSHKLFPHHYIGNLKDEAGSSSCSSFYRQRLDELKGDDWMEIDPNDSHLLDPSKIVTCLLKEGDLLLWDSRTVHCSFPGNRDSCNGRHAPSQHQGLVRAGGLVTMMPKSRATEEVLKGRVEAVRLSRTLTHWANKCALLGEEHEDEASLESRRIELMKKLGPNESNSGTLLGWGDLSSSQKNLVR